MAVSKTFSFPKFDVICKFVGVDSGGFSAKFAPQDVVDKNRAELTGAATQTTKLKVGLGADVAVAALADELIEADGVVVTEPDHALFVVVADCAPIVIFSQSKSVCALIHGGRKNLDAGVVPRTIELFAKTCSIEPADMGVYIGPGVKKESYRLPKERLETLHDAAWPKFTQLHDDDTFNLDLAGFVKFQCQQAGIPSDHIHEELVDTAADRNYYSHYAATHFGATEGRNGFAVYVQPRGDV
jgi:copper oxidase (laccase) domain-containing protein